MSKHVIYMNNMKNTTDVNEGRERLKLSNFASLHSKLLAMINNIKICLIDDFCRYHCS